MRVRHDYTGVDREGFAPDDPFFHAARHHGLEQLAQERAISLYTYYVKNLAQVDAGGLTRS